MGVGIFGELGFGVLGDEGCRERMVVIGFGSEEGLDVDGGKGKFVDVVGQEGMFLVLGGRRKGEVQTEGES